ncbi:permease transmembrane protein [Sulfolobus islandicus rod-shaped virus 3]|uniref:Permease transmembrane protein n=3 Tax=root TaxID=1 RepID=A0A1B3SN12_9VIRU|nr:aminoacid permease [Sulfolobus islandicus rudivirus 3]AOG61569.1 permease transmembrane protein [Sulfolobus islandicus rod-shaped virus 3]
MELERKSSGIVKSFNILDIFSINLLYIGILSGISYPLFVSSLLKNVNLLYAILIGAVFEIPLLLMYYRLTTKYPLNGGDYAYIRTAFSSKFFTIFGISLWLTYVLSQPILGDLVLLNFNIQNQFEQFLIVESLFPIVLLIIANKRIYAKIVDILAIAQIIVALFIVFKSFNFQYQNFTISNTLLSALLFDLSAFIFINAISYIAGEIKNIKKSSMVGYFVSYLVVVILSILDSYSNLSILFALMPIWFFSYMPIANKIQSRLIQTMSFDKVLPETFSKINPNILLLIFATETIANVLENLLGFNISFGLDGLLFIFWNFIIVAFAYLKLMNDKKLFSIVLTSLAIQIFLFFYLGYQNPIFYKFVISGNIEDTILRIIIIPIIGSIVYLLRRNKINVIPK